MPETQLAPPATGSGAGMRRLAFSLPEFTRLAWVSDQAREVWEPRLARLGAAWQEIEWRAVLAGVRRCAVTVATPDEFVDRAPRWAEAGLAALPLERLQQSGQPYSVTSAAAGPGDAFTFRLVIGSPADVAGFQRAWDDADQEAIGDLLGYPPCCREFFQRVWVDDAMMDTTWPMAVATVGAREPTSTIELDGPPQANILWRWMGPRAVPHLPCRFDCPATVALADDLVAVGRACGYGAEMDWLLTILGWPVEWSALHGIAEIKTPVLKVSTATDATAGRYVVRRRGTRRPPESLGGLGFPWRTPVKLRLTDTRGFRRGLDHAATGRDPGRRPAWYATDNGFTSTVAMREAHRPIVELARTVLDGTGGDVLDLGCGNGALLEELVAASPGVVPFGVDLDARRIHHAQLLHPHVADHFQVGDLLDDQVLGPATRRFALVLLMPGRLLEASPAAADALRRRLRAGGHRLLVYAYADWLTDAGGLASLAERAGLALVGEPRGPTAALATVSEPSQEDRHGL